MNVDGFRVIIRVRNTFISARLELESQRAFAVIYDSRFDDAKEPVGRERIEIDTGFLEQVTESEYLYQKVVELPEAGRSAPMMFNPGLREMKRPTGSLYKTNTPGAD